MKSALFLLSVTISLIFISCSSSSPTNDKGIFIITIDTNLFKEYYFITAKSKQDTVYIISSKMDKDFCKVTLNEERSYELLLNKIDTTVHASEVVEMRGRGSDHFIVDNNRKEIWHKGIFITTIYSSPYLRGLCIKK